MAVHPVEQTATTVSDDGTVRSWSLATNQQLFCRKLGKPARSVAICGTGRHTAIGYKDGSWAVFETQSLREGGDSVHSDKHRKEELSDIKFSPSIVWDTDHVHDSIV